jgi:acyl-CoA thioester hydrolase
MKDNHDSLAGFPVVVTIPLLWGDEDAYGHVNNIVYLRWCETARVEYLARIGLWPELPPRGVGPILASISCDYELALTYPDSVHVGARVTRIGNSSLRMEHLVASLSTGAIAAKVHSTLVVIDYGRNTPVRVPGEVRKAIADLEGSSRENSG